MTERPRSGDKKPKGTEETELSDEELARETGEALPDRAAFSTLNADVSIPVNPALAADVLAGPDDEIGEEIDGPDDSEAPAGKDEPEDDSEDDS